MIAIYSGGNAIWNRSKEIKFRDNVVRCGNNAAAIRLWILALQSQAAMSTCRADSHRRMDRDRIRSPLNFLESRDAKNLRDGVARCDEVHGSGPALVLTHGYASTSAMWQG
jgi:hypothetical protein